MWWLVTTALGRGVSRSGRAPWTATDDVMRRDYSSYEDYVAHQRSKLSAIKNPARKRTMLLDALRERLAAIPEISRGSTVLCLGARYGAECEAFIERGAFAVGIDLNPGQSNRFVVTGDFHAIQYADASVDCAYANCLDHVYDLERVLAEVRRVLEPGGVFIVDVSKGSRDADGRDPGKYESFWWASTDALVRRIEASGFATRSRSPFTAPWAGEQAVFVRLP